MNKTSLTSQVGRAYKETDVVDEGEEYQSSYRYPVPVSIHKHAPRFEKCCPHRGGVNVRVIVRLFPRGTKDCK